MMSFVLAGMFVIGLVVGIAIALLTDDQLQEWLNKCHFGKSSAKFTEQEEQLFLQEKLGLMEMGA